MMRLVFYVSLVWLVLVSVPAEAHRFSTSWLTLSSGEDHPAEFDWRWRIVEHDLALVAPFLVDDKGKLLEPALLAAQQPSYTALFADLLQFNADCVVELLPVVHASREVYAGQQSVELYGHAACPMAALQQVSVQPQLFTLIKDHKVIVELTDSAVHGVLSQAQPLWQHKD